MLSRGQGSAFNDNVCSLGYSMTKSPDNKSWLGTSEYLLNCFLTSSTENLVVNGNHVVFRLAHIPVWALVRVDFHTQ